MKVCLRLIAGALTPACLLIDPAPAKAQTALPEIVVDAPSPIVRRHAPRPGPTVSSAPAPVAAAPPAPEPTVSLGTLPIVTDQFGSISVVTNEELRRSVGATLGDILFDKPGITGSSFAPGAASRPIIRGLDVNRVGIVENGIGGGGVSDLGEDHFVPIDPLATGQVEVIRGPATLRYGSQAIGGIVSATNNRIPDSLPCRTERPCASVDLRTALTSVDNGREGAVLLDAGAGNLAVHVDAFGREGGNYRVPRYPYLIAPDPADAPRATQPEGFKGVQPNSSNRSNGHSVGASYVFDRGFIGVAVSQTDSWYRIPGIDPETHNTRIDANQTKVLTKGEFRNPVGFVDAVRFWFGHTDYKHDEIGFADPFDPGTDGVRQTFKNKEQETRIETQFAPFDLRFAAVTTAIGVQAGQQRLRAPSPDEPDSPLNGLFDPIKATRVAAYMFNEFAFSPSTKAQVAGRVEHVDVSGSAPMFIPDVFDLAVDPASIGPSADRNRQFTPVSVSVGLLQSLPFDVVAGVTVQRAERAPKPAELFSRGVHEATVTFDIGNPDLKIEVANSVEASLRRAKGPFRFELVGYYTRFDNFIHRALTGGTCDGSACVAADDPNPLELNQARYSQRDATFRGAEFQSQFDVAPILTGTWGIENQFDIVRATFTDGTNVPRIPPVRAGGGLFWRSPEWLARVNLLHAFAQTKTAPVGETPTGSYNILKAEISHTRKVKHAGWGPKEVSVGVVGTNLLNDDIRNHVSFNKDEVLLPGRGVRAFARVVF